MKAYHVHPGKHFDGIVPITRELPAPGPHEVRVRVRSVALNYRDLMMIRGDYNGGPSGPVIPASDGAGEVIEVGAGVTRFQAGDRVAEYGLGALVLGGAAVVATKSGFLKAFGKLIVVGVVGFGAAILAAVRKLFRRS